MLLRCLVAGAVMLIIGSAAAQSPYWGGSPYRGVDPYAGGLDPIVTYRAVVLGVAAVLGFLIGAFFSPLFAPIRQVILLLVVVLGVGLAVFGPLPGLAEALAVILFFMAFGAGFRLGWKVWRAPDEGPPTSFGTARWATADHLREAAMLGGDHTTGAGFLLGRFGDPGEAAPLIYQGPRHLLTVAPTRSGKGVSAIIPNLLTYRGSALVIDPKGENALVTAERRGRGRGGDPGLGQHVFLIDPWNVAASRLGMKPARFNPLDWIHADDPDAAENAFLLADALVPEGGQGEARFWDDEAKALLTGIILYVATAYCHAPP